MKTMAYYFFKWHSRAQALRAQLFQPLPRTQGTKGQAVTPSRPLLTLQSVSASLRARPRPRLLCSSETGAFSPHASKRLTRCKTPPQGGRGGPEARWHRQCRCPDGLPREPPPGAGRAAPWHLPAKGPMGDSPAQGHRVAAGLILCPSRQLGGKTQILMTAAPAWRSS